MDIFKLIIFSLFFIASNRLNLLYIKKQSIVIFCVQLFLIAYFITILFTNNSFLQIATLLKLIASGIIIGFILRPRIFGSRTDFNYAFFVFFISLFLIQDLSIVFTQHNLEKFDATNPWGYLSSIIFVFSCFSSAAVFCDITSKKFINTIIGASGFIFAFIILTYAGLIEGNTMKSFEGTGGIGLMNFSTNETALLAVCFVIILLFYIRKSTKNKIYALICLSLNLTIILLTQSRIGILCVVIAIIFYMYANFRKRPVLFLFLTFVSLFFLLPLLELVTTIIESRNLSDMADPSRVMYSPFADNLGFTLSGRVIIWEAYYEQFVQLYFHNSFYLFFGTGFFKLVEMYNNSYLYTIGFFVPGKIFFPLHSDLFLTFITGGLISLTLLLFLIVRIVMQAIKLDSFIFNAFTIVLVLFFLFDMLNYSPLQSLLIGMCLGYAKNNIDISK